MELLKQVKAALRLTTDVFDEPELQPIIEACKQDMKKAGVVTIEESDPLVVRAAVLYAKANFGFDPNAEKFQKAYDGLRDSMAQSGMYAGDADA